MIELLEIVKSFNDEDIRLWHSKLEKTFYSMPDVHNINSFVNLICALYWIVHNMSSKKWVVYGAGCMARKYLSAINKDLQIQDIWDKYSSERCIDGVCIHRPDFKAIDTNIMIFVDDQNIREQIIDELYANHFKNIIYFRDYFIIADQVKKLTHAEESISEKTKEVLDRIKEEYTIIDRKGSQVFYTVIPNKERTISIEINNLIKEEKDQIIQKLDDKLMLKGVSKQHLTNILFAICDSTTLFDFKYNLELTLRDFLSDGIKTRKRPIRMRGDFPYDCFAVYETTKIILNSLLKDENKLELVQHLREKSNKNLPLIAIQCELYLKEYQFEKALSLAREAMHIDSNSLFASELFFKTAKTCNKNGLMIEEPLPEYDLNDYFCWSGISFVWCGGVYNDTPDFAPCFRPLQCAAYPNGDFWKGIEWKEFRRSLLDGSFRYCQKNECPNIVAGWLPRKDMCKHLPFKALLEGNIDYIPELTELHFSYDSHCNLCCPSCRTEFSTNSNEDNERYNKLYDIALKPLVVKAKHLCLSGCGEAIISPHSRRILQSLSKKNYPDLIVELRTNVTMLNQMTWNSLGDGKECIKHIAVSIDSARKETFEKLRYPAKFDKVLDNLTFIKSLREKNEIDMFEFHVVVQIDNVNQLLEIAKMAESFNADAVTFSRMINWRGMKREQYDLNNPFWISSPAHEALLKEIGKLLAYRAELEASGRKMYVNIHFQPDPDERYNRIRYGQMKIR